MADISHVKQGDEVVVTIKGTAGRVDDNGCGLVVESGFTSLYLYSDYFDSIQVTKKNRPYWWPLRSGDVFNYEFLSGIQETRYVHGTDVMNADGARMGSVEDYNEKYHRVHPLFMPRS